MTVPMHNRNRCQPPRAPRPEVRTDRSLHTLVHSLDTLEQDAVAVGLEGVHRSAMLSRALAHFRLDTLLTTDIIAEDHLDGSYEFDQHYPDLCSSMFLTCERGE